MLKETVQAFTLSALLMAGGTPAWAETQAPSEDVTVSATKLRQVFHKFLKDFVTPTPRIDKIARWERRLCPIVVGQNSHFTTFVAQRIKYVALAVGAPIDTDASCKPNIEVVFTATPQALLDNVRQHDVFWLGYAETTAELNKLAMVTRPVQAWYTTESVDNDGVRRTDSDIISNLNGNLLFEPQHYAVSGSRISDGVKDGFNHILVVVDSSKLAGQKIVPLADYIALLALTQVNTLDTCQQLTTIANMLAANCPHAEDGLTPFDMAYLQGLYKMSAGRDLMFQRNDIAAMMADELMPQD